MSNFSRPNGFVPHSHRGGGTIRQSQCPYTFDTAYSTSVFTGDVITLNSSGFVEIAAYNSTNVLGIFAGVKWDDPAGSVLGPRFSKYWPASTPVATGTKPEIYIYDDPLIVYQVQAYTGTLFAQTMLGSNANLKANTAGSTLTGQSGMEIDISSLSQSTNQFRILGPVPSPDNDTAAYNVKLLITPVITIMAPWGLSTNIGI